MCTSTQWARKKDDEQKNVLFIGNAYKKRARRHDAHVRASGQITWIIIITRSRFYENTREKKKEKIKIKTGLMSYNRPTPSGTMIHEQSIKCLISPLYNRDKTLAS